MKKTPIKRTDRQRQIDQLDKMASEIVRKRAMARCGGCEKCGHAKTSWKQLQCCHYISRTIFNTRWNLDNLAGLCCGCHRFIDRDSDAKDELWNRLIGEDQRLMLKAQKRYKGKTDLDLVEIYLRNKVKEVGG
jgi:hypothetical protein